MQESLESLLSLYIVLRSYNIIIDITVISYHLYIIIGLFFNFIQYSKTNFRLLA